MPLKFIKQINENSFWGLWHVTEEIGHFLISNNLKLEEDSDYNSISNHYKKLEWLATRSIAKCLVEDQGMEYQGIQKDTHGKPHLNSLDGEISVTHSYPYVAVIYHRNTPVGCDLEKPREKILKIAKKFLDNNEMMFSNQDVIKTTILWSIKESLYKLHGRKFVVFKDNLEVSPFKLEKEGLISAKIKLNNTIETVDLQYICYDDFIITYSVR